jgi:hypothetical protein
LWSVCENFLDLREHSAVFLFKTPLPALVVGVFLAERADGKIALMQALGAGFFNAGVLVDLRK